MKEGKWKDIKSKNRWKRVKGCKYKREDIRKDKWEDMQR